MLELDRGLQVRAKAGDGSNHDAASRLSMVSAAQKLSAATVSVGLHVPVVAMLPAVVQLAEIYARRRNWELFVPRVGWRELAHIPRMIPWSGAALYALVGLAARRSERSLVWPLLLAWLLVPVGVVAATSALDWLRLWHVRYVIGATPAALLLAACLPQWIHGRGKLVVVFGFAVAAAGKSVP